MRKIAGLIAALALALGGSAAAEIYRWTDADGRVHFTQDLSQVPPEHRLGAVERTFDPSDSPGVQTYSSHGAARGKQTPAAPAPTPGARKVYRIPVERAGTAMLVAVRLNGSVTAPFLVDTGASDVAIPKSVANRLGLEPGPDSRTRRYITANGVIEEPVVMLRSVEVGGARAERVPASINSTMEVGLLGLSFFNHFTYRIDAAKGMITLIPNDLEESGAIRGGRSEAQWRSEFAGLRWRIAEIEAEAKRTPPNHSRKLKTLAAAKASLEGQSAQLEAEADGARVPFAWRY